MKKPNSETEGLVFIISDDHSGRDEMNLAGNPFALLNSSGKGNSRNSAHIKYEWNRRLPSGKTVKASWEVSGHAELGLPGPSDELLYLVLLEMTREAAEGGQWPQQVHFSRAGLIERLGWGRTPKYYKLLRDCFARLQSVSIQADNAFWDAGQKAPRTSVGFNILDNYEINDEPRGRKGSNPALPLSFFKWNDVLHRSFNSGNVRSLALEFVLSLEHPTARRLFRYLDMHRNSEAPPRGEYRISLTKLRDHIGMVNLHFTSKVKERLEPAHAELIERGYLTSVEYKKGTSDTIAVYHFASDRQNQATAPAIEPVVTPDSTRADKATIEPAIAFAVWQALDEPEKNRLRQLAREGVEAAFWDRLERPDSPMGLKLWELIVREYPRAYEKKLNDG